MPSLEYARGVYSISLIRQVIRSLLILKYFVSAGETLMILRTASRSSEDSLKSGATEKKREKRGSVNIPRMKMIAELKVLKFFRAISRTAV